MDLEALSAKPLFAQDDDDNKPSQNSQQSKSKPIESNIKRAKVAVGTDPLNIIKKENDRKLEQQRVKNMRKLSGADDPLKPLKPQNNVNLANLGNNSSQPNPLGEEPDIDLGKGKVQKGDFFTDPDVISKNLGFLPAETLKDVAKASFKTPDKGLIGVLALTNFRLLFKFQDERNERKFNFSEDYFKFPVFNILKIEKTQDKKLSYEAYPMDIILKDTRVIRFHVWDRISQGFFFSLTNAINPRDKTQIFEFTRLYGKAVTEGYFNGWDIYDPMKEYIRQGITPNNDLNLRFSEANSNYSLCQTYPNLLVTHKDMTDAELKEASLYRTKNRLPVLSYYYKGNRDVPNPSVSSLSSTPSIWRCSQNKGGITGNKRNESDEKLLKCCVSLCAKLFILDARPYINALANRVNGGGFENMKNYNNVELNFCGIDNIHVAKGSHNKIFQLSLNSKIMENQKFWSSLQSTGWYQFVFLILQHSNFISETLQKNYSVLIHCSDGWDRTAQLITLSQILLDPYFRTIEGLAVLIEKDWLSFGHQFGLRNGIYFFKEPSEDQRAPIFLQWLDCVHQLLYQFPNAFEFNDELLLFLAKNYSTNLYGTFMYNSERERNEKEAKKTSASVWTDVMKNVSKYKNVYYNSQNPVKILSPNYAPYNLHFWSDLFMENNIYLENNKFFLSDIDHSVTFTNQKAYYEYEKRMDVLKYMNLEVKHEDKMRMLYNAYQKIKDKPELFDKLSDKTKEYLQKMKFNQESEESNDNKENKGTDNNTNTDI